MGIKVNQCSKRTLDDYSPRFDFGNEEGGDPASTATIKELLVELNEENPMESGGALDIRSLKTVRRFIEEITGKNLARTTESHPVADIRTIKTLFNFNRRSGMHLIAMMEPPVGDTHAILDFLTATPTQESKDFYNFKKGIISELEKGLTPLEIREINAVCDPTQLGEAYWKATNQAIDDILLPLISTAPHLLKRADDYLAEKTDQFLRDNAPIEKETNLHLATYVYLKILEFVHRLHFRSRMQLFVEGDHAVFNKTVPFEELCEKLSTSYDRPINEYTKFLSIADLTEFLGAYASEISRLVSVATGSEYDRRDVLGMDSSRADLSLKFYLAHVYADEVRNTHQISLIEVIAAFCSVLHQRKHKAGKTQRTHSRKYGGKLASPQKHLDALIKNKIASMPTSSAHVYLERTKWYVHALSGRKDQADSHESFQQAQVRLHKAIFMSLNHVQIRGQITRYRTYILAATLSFVAGHQTQMSGSYWIPNQD